jgi:hypothetical protein
VTNKYLRVGDVFFKIAGRDPSTVTLVVTLLSSFKFYIFINQLLRYDHFVLVAAPLLYGLNSLRNKGQFFSN